jgi:hypothetical protein
VKLPLAPNKEFTGSPVNVFDLKSHHLTGPITKEGGFFAQEPRDGSTLYFLKAPYDRSLGKMPVHGGEPVRALTDVYKWQVLEKGICFLDSAEGLTRIKFFEFATGQSSKTGYYSRRGTPSPTRRYS